MKRGSVLFAFLFIASVTGVASAEDLTGRWGIGGVAGGAEAFAPKRLANRDIMGTAFGGWLRYGLTKNWGLDLAYDNLKLKNDRTDGIRTDIRLQPITLSARYSFRPEHRLMPYISAGLGGAVVNGLHNTTSRRRTVLSPKAALGLEYFLSSQFSLGTAVNYHYAAKNGKNGQYANIWAPVVNATVFFGKPGEKAPVKKAVEAPKAATQLVDSDGDGVWDHLDACPNSPNGAVVDVKGCPSDSDQDGIFDGLDKCPDTPASKLVDQEGCTLPEKVSIDMQLTFDPSSAVIKAEFDAELAKVADFMKKYPTVTAEIEGHTDSAGSEKTSQPLSQKRADAVRKYLIEKSGIAAERLVAKGYGSSRPIADNNTAEGRAKNRRVVATLSTVTK